jgi:hypothetical protein
LGNRLFVRIVLRCKQFFCLTTSFWAPLQKSHEPPGRRRGDGRRLGRQEARTLAGRAGDERKGEQPTIFRALATVRRQSDSRSHCLDI